MISIKRYLKILILWFITFSIVGFILAVAGAGPGGASAILLFICMALGLLSGAIHISVISIVSGNKKQKIIIPLITFLLILTVYWNHNNGINNGYRTTEGSQDYVYIVKDGKWIIAPTVVSFDSVSKYIVGLKLHVQQYKCSGLNNDYHTYSIKMTNERGYFILDTELNQNNNFKDKSSFIGKLQQLDIYKKVELDYSSFDRVWDNHKGYSNKKDFSNCVVDDA